MIVSSTYTTSGSLYVVPDRDGKRIRIMGTSTARFKDSPCRVLDIREVDAFLEYMSCHDTFEMGSFLTVELSPKAREAFIQDIQNARAYLEGSP